MRWSDQFGASDIVAGAALLALALVAWSVSRRLHDRGAPREWTRLHRIVAAGLAFLGVDELTALHETVGLNTPGVPVLEHAGDALLAIYFAGVLALGWYARRAWTGLPGVRAIAALACVLAIAALVVDQRLGNDRIEETLEAAVLLVAAFGYLRLCRWHLGGGGVALAAARP
jgi:hypothetical protein